LAGAVAAFWGTLKRGWPSERRAINYAFWRQWRVLGAHEIIARRSAGPLLFGGCGRSPEPSPEGALEGGF